MPRGHRIDLVGQKFGRLTVERLHAVEKGRAVWACRCLCGNEAIVKAGNLRRGSTSSCGCYRKEHSALMSTTRGLTRSPTYLTWVSMIQRCENPEATGYEYYGGRGVTVCAEWHDFETFLSDMGLRPKDRTLDRRDPNGNYERNNCRWATRKEQRDNQRPRTKGMRA